MVTTTFPFSLNPADTILSITCDVYDIKEAVSLRGVRIGDDCIHVDWERIDNPNGVTFMVHIQTMGGSHFTTKVGIDGRYALDT